MSHWVAANITGGLGNRLFQHAAAMGLAEKWGRPVVFYLPMNSPTNHGPFDNIFRLFPQTPLLIEDEKNILLPEPQGHVFTYVKFQDDPMNANIVVDGWRQTDKYFPAKGVQVALEHCIPKERQDVLLQKYGIDTDAKKQTTYFLHIRLGDYKILPHHQIDVGTYVNRASKEFPTGSKFLVFSDEATQYKRMLEDFVKAVGHVPMVVEEKDELENLFLMSQCWGGAIVANSTFSWWGAYFARQRCLNPALFKACYPDVWGAGLPLARDIVPAWGIRVMNQ